MAFNSKKFLEALNQMDLSGTPVAASPNPFADYMANSSLRLGDANEQAIQLAAQEEAKKEAAREKSALSSVFDFLLGPSHAVLNSVANFTDYAQGEKSGSEALGDQAKIGAATLSGLTAPIREILQVPGMEVPGEHALDEFTQKNLHEYDGTGPMHGSRLLEDLDLQFDESSGMGRVGNAWAGFGVDVATDPLSYLGVGLFTKGGSAKKALETAAATGGDASAFIKPKAAGAAPRKSSLVDDVLRGISPTPQGVKQITIQPQYSKMPAGKVRDEYLPEPHELYSDNTGLPWYSGNDLTNLEELRKAKLDEANQLRYSDEPAGPDNQSLVDLIRNEGVPDSILLDPVWKRIIDGNHRVEAAHSIDPDMPVPYINKGEPVPEARVLPENILESDDFKSLLNSPFRPEAQRSAQAAKASRARWGDPKEYAPGDPNIGLNLAAGKAAKKNPNSVTMKFKGQTVVNPKVAEMVRQSIDEMTSTGTLLNKKPVAPATGFNKLQAEQAADEYYDIMKESAKTAADKSKAKKPVVRKMEMNPANQANLYKRIWEKVGQQLDQIPKRAGTSPAAPRNQKWMRDRALEMMKVAEQSMRVKYGLRAQGWDGTGLSLVSVMEHLGDSRYLDEHITDLLKAFERNNVDHIKSPAVQRAIADALAERSVKTGAVAQSLIMDHAALLQKVKESYSPAAYLRWSKDEGLAKINFEGSLAGLTSKEVDRVVNIAKHHANVDGVENLEPYQILNTLDTPTLKNLATGKPDPKFIDKMNKAFARALNETPQSLAKDITGNKVLDGFLSRFSTWTGRPHDLKQFHQQGLMALEVNAKRRASWFAEQAKNHTMKEIEAAWMLATKGWVQMARGEKIIEPTDKVDVLAAKFRDYLDNILGPHSTMAKVTDLGGTPVVRSGMIVSDIDKQLKALGSTFSFNKWTKASQTIEGLPADYKGANWLFALENVDPKAIRQNPMHLLYDLDLAAERVMTEYAIIDDFTTRFGRELGDAGFDPLVHRASAIPHHRIPQSKKFPTEVSNQMQRLIKDMEDGPWLPKNKAMREFVRRTGQWKRGVTIYNPVHHERNLVGDSWLMWMAGINDPRVFKWSGQILQSEKKRYKEILSEPTLDRLRGLINKEDFAVTQTPSTKVILNKHGADINAYELYAEANQRGLLLSADAIEDIMTNSTGRTGLIGHSDDVGYTGAKAVINQPLGGKGHAAATKVSEYREHYVRMAHFTGYVNKHLTRSVAAQLRKTKNQGERAKIMQKLYDDAAQETRKWHPDGRDLTQYEQKLRLVIPFYAWQRKSIPLIMEGLMKRPAKVTLYPKASFAVQQSLGIESPGPADQFPTDQIYPNFIREAGIGPIGDPESDNPVAAFFGKLGRNYINPITGQEEGYTTINPGNPLQDVVSRQIGYGGRGDIMGGLIGSTTPAYQIPQAIVSGRKPGIDVPISEDDGGQGWAPWAREQVPVLSNFQRFFEPGVERPDRAEDGNFQMQSFLNWLLGGGIRGSGQYYKSAEFDQRDFLKRLEEGNR